MVGDQVFPTRCQPVHEATRDRPPNHVKPCVSDVQEKLGDYDSAKDEEKFEQGETVWT